MSQIEAMNKMIGEVNNYGCQVTLPAEQIPGYPFQVIFDGRFHCADYAQGMLFLSGEPGCVVIEDISGVEQTNSNEYFITFGETEFGEHNMMNARVRIWRNV